MYIQLYILIYAVDPWTTWVLTLMVNLNGDFFFTNYYSTTGSIVGLIGGCKITDMEWGPTIGLEYLRKILESAHLGYWKTDNYKCVYILNPTQCCMLEPALVRQLYLFQTLYLVMSSRWLEIHFGGSSYTMKIDIYYKSGLYFMGEASCWTFTCIPLAPTLQWYWLFGLETHALVFYELLKWVT